MQYSINDSKPILWSRILAILLALPVLTGVSALGREVTLKDNSFVVAFDADSGALTRLESKSPPWNIQGSPGLGASFWLNAQSPDHQDNLVLGQKQHAVEGQVNVYTHKCDSIGSRPWFTPRVFAMIVTRRFKSNAGFIAYL